MDYVGINADLVKQLGVEIKELAGRHLGEVYSLKMFKILVLFWNLACIFRL